MLDLSNKKVIELAEIAGITPEQLSLISDEGSDNVNWWLLTHKLLRELDLPDKEIWLEGLKSTSIDSIDDTIECLKWHLDDDNLDAFRNQ